MKNIKTFTVAITGMNALPENPAAGISVAQCLRKAFGKNLRIVGLGYDAFDVGLYNHTLCDSAYLIPYPRFGSEALLYRLKEIQQNESIDALIPCLDSELFGIIKISNELSAIGIHTFLPSKEQLLRCNKERLPLLAQQTDINYPEIKSLYSPLFFTHCTFDGWTYPLVVKGPFCDAKIVHNSDAAIQAFHEISKDWGFPILVQRYIQGEECNLTAIGDGTGKMIGEITMKKVALTSKNKACVGVTTYDQELIRIAETLIKELLWKGPFELEVMCDINRRYHLLEINPRFPAWISLSDNAGRNLPARLLEMILNLKKTPFKTPEVGTYFIRYAHELFVTLNQIENMVTYGASIAEQKEKNE